DGGTLDLLARRAGRDDRLELLADDQQLVDADPAPVAGLVASRTALLPIEDHPIAGGRDFGRDSGLDQLVGRRGVHLATVRAELAREALSEDRANGGADEERLYAHVDETGQGLRSVVRTDRSHQ